MRTEQEASRAISQYGDTVRRICMIHLKNHADTEDVFQTVFLKYLTNSTEFESEAHEKAWIIRVAINACRDLIRSFFRSRTLSLNELLDQPDQVSHEHREVLEAVLSLPVKYREVVILYYYQQFKAYEIAQLLHIPVSTVTVRLSRARGVLWEELKGWYYDEEE